jgi:hypothetical protein
MSSFIADIGNAFKPGSMNEPIERNVFGVIGIVGIVMSIALAILGAPALLWGVSLTIFSTLAISAIIESRGLAYSACIALFALGIAIAAVTPMPPVQAVWVVY